MTHNVIDLTPTWKASVSYFIAAVQNGTPEGQKMAIKELNRMAGLLDHCLELLGDAHPVLRDVLKFIGDDEELSNIIGRIEAMIQTPDNDNDATRGTGA